MDEKFIEYLVGGKRFMILGGYKFDKLIFGIYVLIVLAVFVGIFLSAGSDRVYNISYYCERYCENPFYNEYPVCEQMWFGACDQEFVQGPFEWNPAPKIFDLWGYIVGGLLFLAFVVNHFVHNKGFKFSKIEGGECDSSQS